MKPHNDFDAVTKIGFKRENLNRPLVLAFVAGLSITALHCIKKESPPLLVKTKIGLLVETHDLDRWKRDEVMFRAKVESMGAELSCAVADGDQDGWQPLEKVYLNVPKSQWPK